MAQEKKAKAYDKALERAKEIINSYEKRGLKELLFYAKEDLEGIFPELRESEDDRIRGAIIDHLKDSNLTEWAAWLEKQGEQKSADKDYTFKSIPRLLEMIEPTDRAKSYCKKLIDSLQTEGYSIDAKIVGECLRQMNGENVPMAVMDIEKQCEQNPFNKVEPKFKNGQWIVFNGLTLYVNEVVQGYYRTTSIGGIPNSYDWNIDNAARLWSIKDAKDGDVLATDSWLYIFKYTNTKALIQFHCTCPINGKPYKWCFSSDDSYLDIYVDANIHPATKEQRDLLSQKMHEAGYTFDFEKKELKKIEDEEYDGEDYGIKSTLVAEIKKRLSLLENGTGDSELMKRVEGVIKGYKSILSFLDTIELKEVDFERELGKYVGEGIHRFFPGVENDYCTMDSVVWQDYVIETAEHFYELGLKAQKGE